MCPCLILCRDRLFWRFKDIDIQDIDITSDSDNDEDELEMLSTFPLAFEEEEK